MTPGDEIRGVASASPSPSTSSNTPSTTQTWKWTTKLFYLALRNISQKWTLPIRDWKAALTRFTIQFGDRISVN